jgi:hypothetical protein
VFENWVLRGIFGAKRDEVTGEWKKLHNEELHDLYCSPNIYPMIKSRKKSVGVACSSDWGRGEACTRFWSENLRERAH